MSFSLYRLAPLAIILAPLLFAIVTAAPTRACETGLPHLIHVYEAWVALAVVVVSLVSAALLVRRALRR